MNGIVVAILAIVLYAAILLLGWRRKLWSRFGITLYGPVMMLRTKRGRKLIERISSRKRFWGGYGRASIYITFLSMVILTLLLVWQAYRTTSEPVTIESPPGADIELPGVNPLTTLIYVVLAFAVATVIHEYAHGIVSAAQAIRLESLGLLLLVIPIGAFVEPNDTELKKTLRYKRARIYSSGPAANLILAAVSFVLLVGVLGPYAQPTSDGALVTRVVSESPADMFGVRLWSEITSVNGMRIENPSQAGDLVYPDPGELLQVDYVYGSRNALAIIPSGVVIGEVWDGPAFNAGIKPGMIIKSLDDKIINSHAELTSVTENSTHDSPVNITVLRHGYDHYKGRQWFIEDPAIKTINLTSKWTYYFTHNLEGNREEFRGKSVMGIVVYPLGVELKDPEFLLNTFAKPFHDIDSPGDLLSATADYLSLPFSGYAPVASEATELYTPAGSLNGIPHDVYWTTLNLLYWLFWVNLLLGASNALPALPLDGGYLLRDGLRELFHRWGLRLTGLDRTIGKTEPTNLQADILTYLSSAIIYGIVLFLFVWQIIWSPA